MNRQQLAHLLRTACQVVSDPEVLVLGSQAVLGTWDEDQLPAAATASMEADIAFLNDPDRAKADLVDGHIGELSAMHQNEGIYAEGIHVSTAILPDGWRDRLVMWEIQASHPARPHFLDPHDLCGAKLLAGRDKDREFVGALLDAGLVSSGIIASRLGTVPPETHRLAIERARTFVETGR